MTEPILFQVYLVEASDKLNVKTAPGPLSGLVRTEMVISLTILEHCENG